MQQSAPAVPQLAAATPQGTRLMQPSFLETLQLTEALTQQAKLSSALVEAVQEMSKKLERLSLAPRDGIRRSPIV
jgi:hypothetical protein